MIKFLKEAKRCLVQLFNSLFPDNWSNSFKFFLCLTYYLYSCFLGNFIDLIFCVFDQTWINSFKSAQAIVYRMLSSVRKIVSASETSSLFSFSYHFLGMYVYQILIQIHCFFFLLKNKAKSNNFDKLSYCCRSLF